MKQRLTELTGVGARASTPETHVPAQRARNAPAVHAPKRSLVRSAIALLLQQPSLALALEPPYRFAALRQPGVELLAELVALVRERPDITHRRRARTFRRARGSRGAAQTRHAVAARRGSAWRDEFLDAMAQLEKQTVQQRIDELQAKKRECGLDDARQGRNARAAGQRFELAAAS